MNKEILQEILRQLTTILSKDEFIKIMPEYDKNKTAKENTRLLDKAVNEHSKKYKAIEDLISKL
jgi:hypothetical protein